MLAILLFVSSALGWTGHVCAQYNVSYTDAAVGDNWTTNGLRPARGAKLMLWNNTLNQPATPWWAGDYALDSGTNVGCRSLTLTNGHSYTITLVPEAFVNGNTVKVWGNTCPSSGYPATCNLPAAENLEILATPPLYAEDLDHNFVPTGSTSAKVTYVAPVADIWKVAAAAGYALFRDNGGVVGETYRFRLDTSASSTCKGEGRIRMSSASRKFMTVHEMGHCVASYGATLAAGDHPLWDDSPQIADDKCILKPTHGGSGLTRRNWLVLAMTEGVGHHYANIVWNNVDADPGTDDDAVMPNLRQTDWNLTGPDPAVTTDDWLVDSAAALGEFSANGCLWCFGLDGSSGTCDIASAGYSAYDGKACYNYFFEAAEVDPGTAVATPVHMEGDVVPITGTYVSSAPSEDHLEFCDGESRGGVFLTTHNRATQIDYSRFLWHMYRDGMDLDDFFGIVVDADPATWTYNSESFYLSSNPRIRMANAATPSFPDWLSVALEHGVHR